MRKKCWFNMIEVVLALGVTMVGICSVMVLFPVGAMASKEAVQETYASLAQAPIVFYTSNQLTSITQQRDWSRNITAPWDPSMKNKVSPNQPWTDYQWTPVPPLVIDGVNVSENFLQASSPDGVFMYVNSHKDSKGVDIVDFRAMVHVREEQIVQNGKKLPINHNARISVEISWPAELPYEARWKTTFPVGDFQNPTKI